MNKSDFVKPAVLLAATGGIAIGVVLSTLFSEGNHSNSKESSTEKKPLYWVAPMDANYRRDKPGKSPMGMDLVPVYEKETGGESSGPGTIKVSPEVINNLGVRTAEVQRQPLHSEIVSVGYVQYDQERLVHIHPRVSGWVDELYVKASGDPVTKDTPLYSLYSPELVNAQEELVLALNRNNTRLVEAAKSRLRALQLPQKFIKQLVRTKEVRQTVTFDAPQDGVVDNLNIREGFYVQPGTTMLSIGALDEVWVEGEIFERQASLVRMGDPVTMKLDYLPGKTWEGRVDYIYPTLDSKTRTMRLRLRFTNPDGMLKPNMFAQITIHADSPEQTLVIPREALIRTGTQDRAVLTLGEGRFKSIAVKAGRQDANTVEILDGLEEGETVVTSAQFLLDSESSKTSDFKRMHTEDESTATVWVAAEILEQMTGDRSVRVQHEPVEAWGWPEMMMDVSVADSVNFSELTPGTKLHMEITRLDDGSVQITGTHIMSPGDMSDDTSIDDNTQNSQAPMEGMDHSQMNHQDINRQDMDHQDVDHSQMNNDNMDHSHMSHEGMDHSGHAQNDEG